MDKIQLLYVTNEMTRKKGVTQQALSFFIQVENIAYNKAVDVLWASQDGVWNVLPATYYSDAEDGKEYWKAAATFHAASDKPLPTDIQFTLRYRVEENEYWDNYHGNNYHSLANSGVLVASQQPLLNIGCIKQLKPAQKLLPITVATHQSLPTERVSIHWTTDQWQHSRITRCYLKRKRDPNHSDPSGQYQAIHLWKGLLNIGDAAEMQYSICCESSGQQIWNNNHGKNFTLQRKPFKLLVLSLHCPQEENQDLKLTQITDAIDALGGVEIVHIRGVSESFGAKQGHF